MASLIDFEETELRLGLPGGGGGNDGGGETLKNNGKRGFMETEKIDLKLNLLPKAEAADKTTEKLPAPMPTGKDPAKPSPAKAQVVGWPPVKSLRRNIIAPKKNTVDTEKAGGGTGTGHGHGGGAAFIKVSMDGAPYLRKVDLKIYGSYQELSHALSKMFSSFTIGNCGASEGEGVKDFMNESKLIDVLNGSEYVPTYEDKDGDWMLVGDVPWNMFVDSCKRLRIMKGSEAIGLAPRALEKCKNRN